VPCTCHEYEHADFPRGSKEPVKKDDDFLDVLGVDERIRVS
jgi:hypothetical protein